MDATDDASRAYWASISPIVGLAATLILVALAVVGCSTQNNVNSFAEDKSPTYEKRASEILGVAPAFDACRESNPNMPERCSPQAAAVLEALTNAGPLPQLGAGVAMHLDPTFVLAMQSLVYLETQAEPMVSSASTCQISCSRYVDLATQTVFVSTCIAHDVRDKNRDSCREGL